LLVLEGDLDGAGAEPRVERSADLLVLVSEDRDHAIGTGLACRRHDPGDHGASRDLVQDLGAIRLHPGAEAGGHDQDQRGLTATHVAKVPSLDPPGAFARTSNVMRTARAPTLFGLAVAACAAPSSPRGAPSEHVVRGRLGDAELALRIEGERIA